MTEPAQPGQDMLATHNLHPDRICVEGAATPIFIVRGHRLASLYRTRYKSPKSFIVPKIRKSLREVASAAFAYLENNEGPECA